MATGPIFPVTIHGTLADVYGTPIAAYANNFNGLPLGVGLQLGMFAVMFDMTIVRLLKASGGINNFDAVTYQTGNSNDYTVTQTSALNQFVVGANDRSGATPLVASNVAWMTTKGIANFNVAPSLTAPAQLVSGATPGQLALYTPGTANVSTGIITGYSIQLNLSLLNTTTSAGAYPVRIT